MDNNIFPLKSSDKIEVAVAFLKENAINQLPVVQNNICIGILSLTDLEDEDNTESQIIELLKPSDFSASINDHIYGIMRVFADQNLSILPVLDENNLYLGCITLHSIIKNYVNCSSFLQPGSIVVLEMDKKNYSLSEIARVVESENKVILSSMISSNGQSERLEITLKLNGVQIQNLLATFERFGYDLKATFDEEDFTDTLKTRYESLMSYLNV